MTDYFPASAANNDLIDLSTLLLQQRYNNHLKNLIGLVRKMFKDTDPFTKTWRCDECQVTDCGHVIINDPGTGNRTHCCSEGGVCTLYTTRGLDDLPKCRVRRR
jgi:hypothetical protein